MYCSTRLEIGILLHGKYRFDEAEYIEKADGSIYYRIELEKGDVDKVVNIGENGTVLS